MLTPAAETVHLEIYLVRRESALAVGLSGKEVLQLLVSSGEAILPLLRGRFEGRREMRATLLTSSSDVGIFAVPNEG